MKDFNKPNFNIVSLDDIEIICTSACIAHDGTGPIEGEDQPLRSSANSMTQQP